jgi:hypothetical protein
MRMMLAAGLIALAAQASAMPYFRPIDPARPRLSAGAFIDPSDAGNSQAGTALAIFTHSPADGCLLPSVACVDWTPLAVGFSAGGGRTTLGLGPSANAAPLARALLLRAVEKVTPEDQYLGLKDSLAPGRSSGSDISVAFGPSLAWNVVERGVILPVNRWKGGFRVFAGAAWKFGKQP